MCACVCLRAHACLSVCYIEGLSEKEMNDGECAYTHTCICYIDLKLYTVLYINDTELLQKNVLLNLVNKDVGKVIALFRRTI